MIDTSKIRGVIFDYGGTIDSNGVHWSEVIWKAYQAENVPITKEAFCEAYIHGERTLGKNPIIQPHHTFLDMMRLKIGIQFEWLRDTMGENWGKRGSQENKSCSRRFAIGVSDSLTNRTDYKSARTAQPDETNNRIAAYCYDYARASVEKARPVLEWLASNYPLVMVSNFYGNMASVLNDFRIDRLFPTIIESAVVGVRKPDPQIFRLGVNALQLQPEEVVVIGDSHDKDIIPAALIGCQTIWLKNTGWKESTGNETADLIISDFAALRKSLS